MLLWGGTDQSTLNDKGETAMHCAVRAAARDSAWVLMNAAGDGFEWTVTDAEGLTPLQSAEKRLETEEIKANAALATNLENIIKLLKGDESGAP